MKKPYKCPFCWNRYGYQHSRALHIEEDHKNVTYNGEKISTFPEHRLAQLDFKVTEIAYNTLEESTPNIKQLSNPVSVRLEQRLGRNSDGTQIKSRHENNVRYIPYQIGSKNYQPILRRIYPFSTTQSIVLADSISPSPPSSIGSNSSSAPDSPTTNRNGNDSPLYHQSNEWHPLKSRTFSDSHSHYSTQQQNTSDSTNTSTRTSVIVQNPLFK